MSFRLLNMFCTFIFVLIIIIIIILFNRSEFFPPGVKQPEREAEHSHPSSAEIKYGWSCTSYSVCLPYLHHFFLLLSSPYLNCCVEMQTNSTVVPLILCFLSSFTVDLNLVAPKYNHACYEKAHLCTFSTSKLITIKNENYHCTI